MKSMLKTNLTKNILGNPYQLVMDTILDLCSTNMQFAKTTYEWSTFQHPQVANVRKVYSYHGIESWVFTGSEDAHKAVSYWTKVKFHINTSNWLDDVIRNALYINIMCILDLLYNGIAHYMCSNPPPQLVAKPPKMGKKAFDDYVAMAITPLKFEARAT